MCAVWLIAGWSWLFSVANAQVEACPGPLPLSEWREAMDSVDQALIALNGALADRILDDIIYELRCLRVPAPPAELGRLARQIALVAFYAQDNDELRVWIQLARETVGPDEPWPKGVPIPERFFTLIEAVGPPRVERAEGFLQVPRGGAALLDGFVLQEAAASDPVQHLLQIADKRGEILLTDWQNGADFPEEWLSDRESPLPIPSWYQAPERPEPVAPEPVPEPVPESEPARPEPPTPEPVVRFDGHGLPEGCPWKSEPNIVTANGREVRINRHTYPVRTEEQQQEFRALLRTCGEYRAARRFTRWRTTRAMALGGVLDGVGRYKRAMIVALVTHEPVRKRR